MVGESATELAEASSGKMSCLCMACIEQASVGIVEKWGRFSHMAQPGCHLFNPLAGEYLAGSLSLRVQHLEVRCLTKSKVSSFPLRPADEVTSSGRELHRRLLC